MRSQNIETAVHTCPGVLTWTLNITAHVPQQTYLLYGDKCYSHSFDYVNSSTQIGDLHSCGDADESGRTLDCMHIVLHHARTDLSFFYKYLPTIALSSTLLLLFMHPFFSCPSAHNYSLISPSVYVIFQLTSIIVVFSGLEGRLGRRGRGQVMDWKGKRERELELAAPTVFFSHSTAKNSNNTRWVFFQLHGAKAFTLSIYH